MGTLHKYYYIVPIQSERREIIMKDMNTKTITRLAILMALTTVMTMVIHIPTIGTNGYLNLGDMVVLLAVMLLGKKGGFIVGGLGSGLADRKSTRLNSSHL